MIQSRGKQPQKAQTNRLQANRKDGAGFDPKPQRP